MVESGSRDRVLTPDWPSHARLPRDVTNCGPEDTPPPNRVNTSEQLRLVRGKMEEVTSRASNEGLRGKAPISTFTFMTLSRHYAKLYRLQTHKQLNTECRSEIGMSMQISLRIYAIQPSFNYDLASASHFHVFFLQCLGAHLA